MIAPAGQFVGAAVTIPTAARVVALACAMGSGKTEAIAAHLATTPETVTRSLTRLQEMDCIRFDRHRIIITDETRLRALALLY